ncbi:MAG: hypothetical protein methR_P2191 [Methyloprofundus sp.]|nr:MAG: hypothetical protein methR_P2191 [Methyloprofundus sp.]
MAVTLQRGNAVRDALRHPIKTKAPMTTSPAFDHHPNDLLLDYYHCTLFLPLLGLTDEHFTTMDSLQFSYSPVSNPQLAAAEAQAYLYFSPALRNILFDLGDSKATRQLTPIKEWRLPEADIQGWQLHLGQTANEDDPAQYQRSNIISVRLLQYFNGIYLLAVRVVPEALVHLNYDTQQKQTIDFFKGHRANTVSENSRQDPDNADYYQQLAMENWLHFTRNIRLLYPSFPQQRQEGKIDLIHLIRPSMETVSIFQENAALAIPQKPGEYFSPIMSALLHAFANQPCALDHFIENDSNLYDDRMFVSVAYGIAGEQLPEKSLQRINTLVSHIDRQEADGFSALDGYAYTPAVILAKTEQHAFTLWQGLGGYYSYTDFSNSYLYNGFGFRDHIAPEHIPHIYDRMLVQALFYQASLRHYDQKICADTKDLLGNTSYGLAFSLISIYYISYYEYCTTENR